MFSSQSEFQFFRSQPQERPAQLFSGGVDDRVFENIDFPERKALKTINICDARFSEEFASYFKGRQRLTGGPFQVPESSLRVTSFADFALGSYVAKVADDNRQAQELIATPKVPLEILYVYSRMFPEDLALRISLLTKNCLSVADEFSAVLHQRWREMGFTSSQAPEIKGKLDRAIELNQVLNEQFRSASISSPISPEFKFVIRSLGSSGSGVSIESSAREVRKEIHFEIEKLSELVAEQIETVDRHRSDGGLSSSSTPLDTLYFSTRPWKGVCPLTLDDMSIARGAVFYRTCSNLNQVNPVVMLNLLESAAYRIELRETLTEMKPLIRKFGLIGLEVAFRVLRAGFGL